MLTICCLALLSCNKNNEPVNKTFYGELPIVQTNTPATAIAGQDIQINVRCQLPSINGTVTFEGFDIQETTLRNFSIAAKAFYKNWSEVGLSVLWTLDTVATVRTTTAGTYVLQFYHDKKLQHTNTVQVN
jgi:hypothetical protein